MNAFSYMDALLKDGAVKKETMRDLLKHIDSEINSNTIFKFNGRFIEVTVDNAETDYKFKHLLNTTPYDVIMLSVRPHDAVVTWKYESFTKSDVIFDTSKACSIRCLVGVMNG